MGGFKLGTSFGDFSLALLVAVLMDIHHIPFDILGEGKLFEWMDAIRDLMTTGVAIGFLLDHIRDLGEMWFCSEREKEAVDDFKHEDFQNGGRILSLEV